MVGYVAQPIFVEQEQEEQEQDQDSNSKNLKHPLDPLEPTVPDFSFVDSLLDFDFMEDFLLDNKIMEVGDNETSLEAPSVAPGSELMLKEEPLGLDSGFEKPPSVADVSELIVKEETLEVEKDGNLGAYIEEKLGRFSLVGNDREAHSVEEFVPANELLDDQILMTGATVVAALASIVADKMSDSSSGNDNDDGGGGGSDSESGKESSSSSSSSSGSSDDDADEEEEEEDDSDEKEEEEVTMKLEEEKEEEQVTMKLDEEVEEGEMEEGEIRDDNEDGMVGNSDDEEEEEEDGEKMVEWSDSEFVDIDEEEDGFGGVKGPIKSKNEVEVLPPVPPVEATLEPHHQMLPVGIVLSTLGAQVIVEGTDKHNPLNEGSILWITEKRSPLGIVDEIFGPVQNPYYVVRFNSETEVPAEIHQGTLISFVAEFAHHVLGEKNLYKKGYDASGEHDEELTDDGEFSDDEKEAEHKRMQKMSKRGLNQQTGNDSRRKNKNRNRNRNGNGNGNQNNTMPLAVGQQPPNHNQQNQHNASTAATSSMNNGAFFPPFRPMVPTNGNFQPPNAGWLNPMPSQQPNAAFIPGGFPGNNMPWPAQNQPFQQPFNLNQGLVPNGVFPGGQGSGPNGVFPGGQMNLFANGPSPMAMAAQNCFNQALLGMGFQMQQPNLPMMNLGGQQGMMCNPNQPQVQHNSNFQPPQMVASGDTRPPQQFNSGASSGRGSRPYQRGGSRGRGRGRGRFSGGRGR